MAGISRSHPRDSSPQVGCMSEQNGQSRSLSVQLAERNISPAQWHTLAKSLYPGARPESVLLVIDYCRARNLDPLKKPCHIVPMEVTDARTGKKEWRDVVLPGIYELRTTAQRTGAYLGHTKPEYGPMIEHAGVTAPEWCEMTMRRAVGSHVAEFPVRVYFREVCGVRWDKDEKAYRANSRWAKAPIQMLTKCTEAAGLREAFPDEIGGEMAAEEIEGQTRVMDMTPKRAVEDLNAELGLVEREEASTDGEELVEQYSPAASEG